MDVFLDSGQNDGNTDCIDQFRRTVDRAVAQACQSCYDAHEEIEPHELRLGQQGAQYDHIEDQDRSVRAYQVDMRADVFRNMVRDDQCQDEQGNIDCPQEPDPVPDGSPVCHDYRIDHDGNQAYVKYRQAFGRDAGIVQRKARHDHRNAQQCRYDQIGQDIDPVFSCIHVMNDNMYRENGEMLLF